MGEQSWHWMPTSGTGVTMRLDKEDLLFRNWQLWRDGGLDAETIAANIDRGRQAQMLRWYHAAYDEADLPRPAAELKQVVDIASWCLYRRDTLLHNPAEMRERFIASAAKSDFEIPAEILSFLIRTCGVLLSVPKGKGVCRGADCVL